MEDDLDLFLALAEEASGEQPSDQRHDGAKPAAEEEEGDDLDLFLQLADEAAAPQEQGAQQQQQQQRPPVAAASAPRVAPAAQQQRLSGWAAPKGSLPPGVIPSARPDMLPPPPLAAARQQGSAFQVVGSQVQRQLAASQAAAAQRGGGGGKPGVFKDIEQGSIIERLSGLKIKNPLVSSAMVRARLADASVVKLSQLRSRHRSTGLEGAWATICVIGEKSKPRESQGGRPYSIWKVTDLDQTSHSLFLFGAAHGDLWKENVGTLVALFSPKVKTDSDFALSADSSEQVWVLGSALEFGYCKANKKNGEPCRMPVNAARCPYCPYHVQSEYNRLKPTRRNEFQETNLKTAFRQGMQRGLQWQPGQFAGEGPRPAAARMPVLPAARLETTAEAARDKGSSTGARYLKTVANPAAAVAACQEREVLQLRHNKLGPNEAPIPLPRASHVVMPTTAGGGGGRRAGVGPPAGAGKAGGLPAKRKASEQGGSGGGSCVLLECDIFEDDARQRAIELVKAMGGTQALDPNKARRTSAIAEAEAQRLKAARLGAAHTSPAEGQPRGDSAAASGGSSGDRRRSIGVSPLEQLGEGPGGVSPPGIGAATAAPARAAAGGGSGGPGPSPAAAAAPVGRLGGTLFNPAAAAAAAAGVTAGTAGAADCTPPQPSAAAAAVAARGYQPPAAPQQGKKGAQPASSRSSIMSKLGLKPAGGASAGSAGKGSQGAGKPPAGTSQQQQQGGQQPKSAFEAAFGTVIEEMQRTAGGQTSSRYKSSVDEEDQERIDKMLSVLEQKDEMAQKMDSVKQLSVQAFCCKLCNYTFEKRRPECAAHSHLVERVQATKRWWECEHCKYRFSSVGVRYPTKRCTKCQHPQTDFKAVSMYRPAKQYDHEQVAVASRDKLLARGTEQKWVFS